jgi:hypothetical protein
MTNPKKIAGFALTEGEPNKAYWNRQLSYFRWRKSQAISPSLKKYYQDRINQVRKNIKALS